MADIKVVHGDSREAIREIPDASIDSCVTDPPYALISIVKRFGADGAAEAKSGKSGVYKRASSGFMGQLWDTGEVAHDPEFWREVYRVLKPGAHVVAFSGTRTQHRQTCAIEDAGFEIRDQIGWLFGSGFPKSHNQPGGIGTALKPAWEPVCLARKPLIGTVAANIAEHGTGGLNIDGCRIGDSGGAKSEGGDIRRESQAGAIGSYATSPKVEGLGRWPANVVHDGSDEVVDAFPQSDIGGGPRAARQTEGSVWAIGADRSSVPGGAQYGDVGSAARFFYSAKADAEDRLGSKHPTVKPVDLMAWLCRLVTPAGGTVLDPFAGTGTTGLAAMREGFDCILIEREAQYVADIERRLAWARGEGRLTAQETARVTRTVDDLPLFAGPDDAVV